MLAYCLTVKVQEQEDGDTQAPIPSAAIIEDIIADVELMKGQSAIFGDKFQVFDDVCISYDGMAMSTGRTFDMENSSRRAKSSGANCVQVMLIHEQIPNLTIEDNISETNLDWENQVEFSHLSEHTV